MIQINPYRRNCEVIKNFFSNPLILIISILLFTSSIASIAINLLVNSTLSIPIVGILSAVGFLLFYLKGKSKNEVTSFSAPANLLTTSSVVAIILNTLAVAVSILLLCLTNFGVNLLENTASYISIGSLDFVFTSILKSFIIYIPMYALNILSAIAMLVLLGSFKKSSTSIYLYKKGSIFFAVSSFVLAVIQITLDLFNGISLSLVLDGLTAITLISLGIFAIMYNRYITNVSSNISVPKPVAETIDTTPQPVQAPVVHIPQDRTIPTANEASAPKKSSKRVKPDYDASLVNMWDIPNNSVAPNTPAPKDFTPQNASFDPKPVFAQPTPDYDYPDSPILAQDTALPVQPVQNTYEPQPVFTENNTKTENAKPVEEKPFSFCTFCGQKCPPENLYCGACGNKLTK